MSENQVSQSAAPITAAEIATKEVKKAKPAKAKKSVAKAKKAAPKARKPSKANGETGPGVLRAYAPNYTKGGKDGKAKTAGGNTTIDNADALAEKLRGKDIKDVYEMAAKVITDEDGNKLTVNQLRAKYGKLNVGMQRMNLGNRMRAVLNAK